MKEYKLDDSKTIPYEFERIVGCSELALLKTIELQGAYRIGFSQTLHGDRISPRVELMRGAGMGFHYDPINKAFVIDGLGLRCDEYGVSWFTDRDSAAAVVKKLLSAYPKEADETVLDADGISSKGWLPSGMSLRDALNDNYLKTHIYCFKTSWASFPVRHSAVVMFPRIDRKPVYLKITIGKETYEGEFFLTETDLLKGENGFAKCGVGFGGVPYKPTLPSELVDSIISGEHMHDVGYADFLKADPKVPSVDDPFVVVSVDRQAKSVVVDIKEVLTALDVRPSDPTF